MSKNPLNRLQQLGQSVWLDYIRRDLIESGQLLRLIETDSLGGMTSNPTIFSSAIATGQLYDQDIRAAGLTEDSAKVFERIAVEDIRRAADVLRSVHDQTQGRDGLVSIECRPALAYDTQATIEEARNLWRLCDRPNVMVKIPGTRAGLPAIESCLAEGININITLLFSVERYREVMEAWLQALERRVRAGQSVDRLASVASFFVSRVDTKIDKQLEQRQKSCSGPEQQRIESLKAQFGIANARLAYQAFEEMRRGPRFQALDRKGARVQRPLWASTSTKNPALPDIYYVEALVASDSVNTAPLDTIDAYRDHGDPKIRIHDDLSGAQEAMEALAELGIDFAAATRELEQEGVQKFSDSYDELLQTIAKKQKQMR
jgi:transaldolase